MKPARVAIHRRLMSALQRVIGRQGNQPIGLTRLALEPGLAILTPSALLSWSAATTQHRCLQDHQWLAGPARGEYRSQLA